MERKTQDETYIVDPKILKQLDDAVREVFALMLDRCCFPQTSCYCNEQGFTASVLFAGAVQGFCTLHLNGRAAKQLATDLMGESAEDPIESNILSADTTGELCNMIAGSWKSRLAGGLSICTLSPPKVISYAHLGTPKKSSPESNRSLVRSYRFGDYCFSLELIVDKH